MIGAVIAITIKLSVMSITVKVYFWDIFGGSYGKHK